MSKRYAQRGITLFEVLVAIAVAGLMAVITIPKISTPLAERESTIIGRVDAIRTQMVLVYNATVDAGDVPGTAPDTYEQCMLNYGSFFAYKDGALSPYVLLNDGSRLYFDPVGLGGEADTLTRGDGTASTCGNYLAEQCFYLDVNGEAEPNTIGKRGDIIPIRMDPTDGTVKTLYKWQKEAGFDFCRYESSYDFFTGESDLCT